MRACSELNRNVSAGLFGIRLGLVGEVITTMRHGRRAIAHTELPEDGMHVVLHSEFAARQN